MNTDKAMAEYKSWQAMRTRCNNPRRWDYPYYGGRGISVCERWESFERFLADMGPRPKGTTLDRYPNKDGNYEPENCRWATYHEQGLNRRPSRPFIKPFCKHGHKLEEGNLILRKNGQRYCKICKTARDQEYAKARATQREPPFTRHLCRRGHKLEEGNLLFEKGGKVRRCKICRLDSGYHG